MGWCYLELLLVVGEATQPALRGDDMSVSTAIIAIATLLTLDVAFSLLKRDIPSADRIGDAPPGMFIGPAHIDEGRAVAH